MEDALDLDTLSVMINAERSRVDLCSFNLSMLNSSKDG